MVKKRKISFLDEVKKKTSHIEEIEDIDELNATGNLDGGKGPPKIPRAFSKKIDKKRGEVLGYKRTEKTNIHFKKYESIYKKMMKQINFINEISYKDYKSDESVSNKHKINQFISEMNSKLIQLERVVKQNIKLKQELKITPNNYWKVSRDKLTKITERLIKLGGAINKLYE